MPRHKTRRLTMAQALVASLDAQHIDMGRGRSEKLCGGVFAIFGHGNVTCLGEALHAHRRTLPTYRGQNEQGMGLACVGYARARRRRGFMAATSSIGPGATNMVTAAAVAHANRLPALFIAGDTFANRLPDPVLQQVENRGDPSLTVNDAFRPVVQYWDRVVHPAQLVATMPQLYASLLDPGGCGPAFLALPQDVQEVAYPYPESFFAETVHGIPRPRADRASLQKAAALIAGAKRPLLVAGGGARYSLAEQTLADFARRRGIPVVETLAGRSTLAGDHECNAGPLGVTGSSSANAVAPLADVVIAVGTRLQDFTTASGSLFWQEGVEIVALNASPPDAVKRGAHAVVGDAKASLEELDSMLGRRKAPPGWLAKAQRAYRQWDRYLARVTKPTKTGTPTYGQVMGAVNRLARKGDRTVSAAGGMPGEHNKIWKSREPGDFDCEFGFSCMGYETSGAYGFKMGCGPRGEVISLMGDGSYLMMNSDILSSVMTGHKVIFVVCDNGGFAVINRLQTGKGGAEFNNLFRHCTGKEVAVDFVAHARSMGAGGEWAGSLAEFEEAFDRARRSKRSYVIAIKVAAYEWTGGDAWWDTGVPEVSRRPQVKKARKAQVKGRAARQGGQ
ncbi:MAG: 3D-(3,5/4)-trihydroxycyclohexane-1,2-dione acylhydrolase (decyclizing) [Betaproteobacteria bacterium AqS2]|uniref:3D-(3,5/4)-trihydroxycyclohexane-1,2-dione acylhydrolase (Decyclizing) n=1 Tax=Candidatus Amphirhobacter heronislandensis TaxID=1732024 RepID=A0A930XY86_9GAMM|nr:3D-(3,5/4)-trihydroxycyclohexane-1,2-dione acylhydrolase (decyclizing) [Betaproteobacteria bacterium AqS2]